MNIGYLLQAGAPDMRVEPLSGPAAHVWHVCHELQGLGHSLRLLMLANGGLWRSDDLKSFQPVSVPNLERGPRRLFERGVRRGQSQLHLPYLHLFESLHFAAACRQELGDCDLFYERMGWMGYGGAIAARRMSRPLVLEVNGDHLTEYEMLHVAPQGLQRTASLRIMRWATHQASHVIATGEGWRRRFLERWQVEPQRVSVVENGSEMVDLLTRDELAVFRPPAGASAPVQLVYVGAFEPWHGVSVLLEALALAAARGALLHLHLVGDGSETPAIRRLIGERNLSSSVTLHGFLPMRQAAPLLRDCEIGFSPYCGRVEFSGLKLLDYKAAGLAVIASGQNGEPSVLQHGVTGWITPPCDAQQLAAAIVALCEDVSLRRRIGQAARCEAEEQHSWRATARQVEQILLGLVQP